MERNTKYRKHRSWAEYPADCEYCGQNAKPLLDLSWQRWPEKALAFCCVQREQLYELLEVDRCMAAGRYVTPQEAVINDPAQFDMGWTCGFVYTFEIFFNCNQKERVHRPKHHMRSASDCLVLQKDAGPYILAPWLSSISKEKPKRSGQQARPSTSLPSLASVTTRLDLNKSVGRCLEQDGSRLRQWTWSGLGRVPTVLDPLHLNLNERVTLQILGREQVFISFQECGEEVKFSVGSCSC
ncbi:unnamed protein product [Tetraodon nigroviridis]|uniref:(spotted green pufferfish) hypothetical protein n=1 Tax=Tetraodon nigroviridis TaxID=99883 RepID=Q4RVD9_TETNG|nr:unnamed protein product [Tetraodon nigroviridis]